MGWELWTLTRAALIFVWEQTRGITTGARHRAVDSPSPFRYETQTVTTASRGASRHGGWRRRRRGAISPHRCQWGKDKGTAHDTHAAMCASRTSREHELEYVKASALRKGGMLLMNDKPCKIVEIKSFKSGKHGVRKLRITGKHYFNESKQDVLLSSNDMVERPIASTDELQLVNVNPESGYVALLTTEGDLRSDLRIEDQELLDEVSRRFEADEYLMLEIKQTMGVEQVMGFKVCDDNV